MILYEMLSGKRAFNGDSVADVMSAILKEEPPDLKETNGKISTTLEKIVRRCLEKNPERRFQTASDLGFALEALSTLSSSRLEPVSATRHRSGGKKWWIGATVLSILTTMGFAWAYFTRQSTADVLMMKFSGPLIQGGSISPASLSCFQTRLGAVLFSALTSPFQSPTTAC
jgi:serine/threonine protein kinase